MPRSTHTFQAPKGTRDFYPGDLAVRRHIESVWREVSVGYGFDEIDGPTFEHLDLYTVKSGTQIVSELFSFRRQGGDVDYALRPEFTPTLARMYAARAGSLSKPTKWFSIGPFFRAERPQRGRLREHIQWNLDVIGDETPAADAEVITAAAAVLERCGLSPKEVRIKISHRVGLQKSLLACGAAPDALDALLVLIDRLDRQSDAEFDRFCAENDIDDASREAVWKLTKTSPDTAEGHKLFSGIYAETEALRDLLTSQGVDDWIAVNPAIVRGLAYYTGIVFEIHETGGKERAIAGGGRYDHLVELFGGPPTPAVGVAMGDVVLRLVLEDRGLLEPSEAYAPRPDAFVISTGKERAEAELVGLIGRLRRAGLHVRHSYRATRNVGKLLGEAARARARYAVILGTELDAGNAVVKNLDSTEQQEVPLDKLEEMLRKESDQ